MRLGPSSSICGTDSQSSRTGTKTPCSGGTGQSPRDRSKRRWYLPMDDGWKPTARSSRQLSGASATLSVSTFEEERRDFESDPDFHPDAGWLRDELDTEAACRPAR